MFKSLNLKEAMATSIGMQWRHGATILTKFKLFGHNFGPCNWQFWLKFGQILAQWTVVVIIISSKCQLFIPIMLCESLAGADPGGPPGAGPP